MKYLFTVLCFLLSFSFSQAQITVSASRDTSWKTLYRATTTRINDLVHTRLDVQFDYDKAYLYGKAWITLRPHFYATDSLTLDAKGMNIEQVALVKGTQLLPLKYTYDSSELHITLNKKYSSNETYTVFVQYVSKPNEYKAQGSAAITDAKGLYFINPKGEEKDKPTQIWTQGETESNSVWFPTIDKPNQKCTEEISMTVPAQYVTLSNGLLIKQKKNSDGTRTDTWKLDKPHSPYLFFMGVGDYAIIKDSYKGKEVSYYVEKEYAPVARKIFGNTPEMIQFFSNRLQYEYAWPKYSQITARDYVSGAMENTTSTLHFEYLQQNARELTDGNQYEDIISHELFHHWFGDLVTCESWSNLTLNESFADYSEYLWKEYKYGKDAADAIQYTALNGYLNSGSENKDLVRFFYRDKEDMFDAVSYQKGGRILHMLRNYLGDSAFFKGLNLYLKTNQFANAEAHQLRLALEEVSGKDLNWFFNQWYFGSGHPELDIQYAYDSAAHTAKVIITQNQESGKIFKLPFAIDVYVNNKKTRYPVWVKHAKDSFLFPAATRPNLIDVDAEKILLAQKTDHKTLANYIYQYQHAGSYFNRKEAVDYCAEHFDEQGAEQLLLSALNDAYFGIRNEVLTNLIDKQLNPQMLAKIESMAKTDNNRLVRGHAIRVLANTSNASAYKNLFIQSVTDSSYSVSGAALQGLMKVDEEKALTFLPALQKDARGNLKVAVEQLEFLTKTDADFDSIFQSYAKLKPYEKYQKIPSLIVYLKKLNNEDNFKKALDQIIIMRNMVGAYYPAYKEQINQQLNEIKEYKEAKNKSNPSAAIQNEIDYLNKKLNE